MRSALAILLLPALAGAQAVIPAARPHQAPAVRLLEPGATPRAALRYRLKAPQELTVVASGDWTVKQNSGASLAVVFPQMTTPLRMTPGKGEVAYLWLKPSLVYPPNQRKETLTEELLLALEGSSGVMTTDARGVISRFVLRASPTDVGVATGTMQQRSLYATQMGKGMLGLLDVPLPEEPVGPGARWQVERLAIRGGISFVQVNTYTLVKREADALQLSFRFGGKWDEGSGVPEQQTKLEVSGGGTCKVDLGLPFPTALEDEVQVYAQLTAQSGVTTEQLGTMRTRIESK